MPSRLTHTLLAFGGCLSVATTAAAADTWTTPYPGVRHLYRTTSDPLRIHALVVDLCSPGVSVRATASSERKRTASSFGNLVGAEAVINGDFFNYSNYATTGLSVGNGERWSDTADSTWSGFLAFGASRAGFSDASELVSTPESWMSEVVSGHAQIVKDGTPVTTYDCSGHFCQREPRSAAGMSANRRTLYLMVVDGRTTVSIGVTLAQLAALMHDVGAHDALNLDGGGSTTMWLASEGVVNAPSGGTQRVVANHLAVQAGGAGMPGNCTDDPDGQLLLDAHLFDARATSDVDGDGLADICARAAAGVRCHLSSGTAITTSVTGPELSDAVGWDDASNYGTMRTADVNGDGFADVCARANAAFWCWISTGDAFDERITGPAWSDADGWNQPKYYTTIRMLDLDGDGRTDVCGRGPDGVRCHLSTGDGFGPELTGPSLTDASGWGNPQYYGTIRAGDVNGDGKDDLCARAAKGMMCWLSDGSSVQQAIDGPAWSNDAGWGAMAYWSTIRLSDIDADGMADLCGRDPEGLVCHRSTGDGFGDAIRGPALADASGWADRTNYATLRMADVTGDGKSDVCARANAGIRCWPSTGDGFGDSFVGPALSDDDGWFQSKYYDTIRLVDVDGDGRADLCARGPEGVTCWPSQGDAFGDGIEGPAFADSVGWGNVQYFSTIRAGGPVRPEPDVDAGAGGSTDASADTGAPSEAGAEAGTWTPGDASNDGSAGAAGSAGGAAGGPSADAAEDSSGCACEAGSTRSGRATWWLALSMGLWIARRRRA